MRSRVGGTQTLWAISLLLARDPIASSLTYQEQSPSGGLFKYAVLVEGLALP